MNNLKRLLQGLVYLRVKVEVAIAMWRLSRGVKLLLTLPADQALEHITKIRWQLRRYPEYGGVTQAYFDLLECLEKQD